MLSWIKIRPLQLAQRCRKTMTSRMMNRFSLLMKLMALYDSMQQNAVNDEQWHVIFALIYILWFETRRVRIANIICNSPTPWNDDCHLVDYQVNNKRKHPIRANPNNDLMTNKEMCFVCTSLLRYSWFYLSQFIPGFFFSSQCLIINVCISRFWSTRGSLSCHTFFHKEILRMHVFTRRMCHGLCTVDSKYKSSGRYLSTHCVCFFQRVFIYIVQFSPFGTAIVRPNISNSSTWWKCELTDWNNVAVFSYLNVYALMVFGGVCCAFVVVAIFNLFSLFVVRSCFIYDVYEIITDSRIFVGISNSLKTWSSHHLGDSCCFLDRLFWNNHRFQYWRVILYFMVCHNSTRSTL